MSLLVPSNGAGFVRNVESVSPSIVSLGPFPQGSFIDRVSVSVACQLRAGATALRLGFALGGAAITAVADFLQLKQLIDTFDPVQNVAWFRLDLSTGQHFAFDFFPGVLVQSGPLWVVVYSDLTDGTDTYTLAVSVRASRTVPDGFGRRGADAVGLP